MFYFFIELKKSRARPLRLFLSLRMHPSFKDCLFDNMLHSPPPINSRKRERSPSASSVYIDTDTASGSNGDPIDLCDDSPVHKRRKQQHHNDQQQPQPSLHLQTTVDFILASPQHPNRLHSSTLGSGSMDAMSTRSPSTSPSSPSSSSSSSFHSNNSTLAYSPYTPVSPSSPLSISDSIKQSHLSLSDVATHFVDSGIETESTSHIHPSAVVAADDTHTDLAFHRVDWMRLERINHPAVNSTMIRGITSRRRYKEVMWLSYLCEHYDLQTETFHYAVQLLDRYLYDPRSILASDRIMLVAVTCLLISSKINEMQPLTLEIIHELLKGKYSYNQIKTLEGTLLNRFQWRFTDPTPMHYIRAILHLCPTLDTPIASVRIRRCVDALLLSPHYVCFYPSQIAAAALYMLHDHSVALYQCIHEWTSYTMSDVSRCIVILKQMDQVMSTVANDDVENTTKHTHTIDIKKSGKICFDAMERVPIVWNSLLMPPTIGSVQLQQQLDTIEAHVPLVRADGTPVRPDLVAFVRAAAKRKPVQSSEWDSSDDESGSEDSDEEEDSSSSSSSNRSSNNNSNSDDESEYSY
jgi:hypothetical protein